MKLLFVFVFLSSVAFGQISVSELIKVAKMDSKTFEKFSIEKGYHFHEINKSDSAYNCIRMEKFDSIQQNHYEYLKFCNIQIAKTHTVTYHPLYSKELSSIYKELNTLEFHLYEINKSQNKRVYKRGNKEFVRVNIWEEDAVEVEYELGY